MTDDEWLEKAMYEGGVYEAFSRGIVPDNMHDKTTSTYYEANQAFQAWLRGRVAVAALEKKMIDIELRSNRPDDTEF